MSPDSNYSKHAILFIDDEEQSQKYFSQIFGRIFKIYLASDAEEGLKLFEEFRDEIGVVVSDQRMPGMPGMPPNMMYGAPTHFGRAPPNMGGGRGQGAAGRGDGGADAE